MPMARPMPTCDSALRRTNPRTSLLSVPQRHSDADLIGSSGDDISCYAIQPDANQNECENTKHLCKPRNEPLLIKVARDLRVEAHHPQYSQIGVNLSDRFANNWFEVVGPPGYVKFYGTDPTPERLSGTDLQQRQEEGGVGRATCILIFCVLNYANNLVVTAMTKIAHAEVVADRIFPRKESARQCFVYHGNSRCARTITSMRRPSSNRVPMV